MALVQFAGERTLAYPFDHVSARLNDASWLASSLLHAEQVQLQGPDRASWKVRPPVSFVSGLIESTITVLERQAGRMVRWRIVGKSVGASSTTEITMHLEADGENRTRVKWSAEVTEMTGLLKLAPKGLVAATANKVVEEVWQGVERKLAAGQ
jgi:carbon monoxide dehydrogenase subunit G